MAIGGAASATDVNQHAGLASPSRSSRRGTKGRKARNRSPLGYFSAAYSRFASIKTGTSGSASFQNAKKSW